MLSNYLGTNRVQNEQFDVILSQSVTLFFICILFAQTVSIYLANHHSPSNSYFGIFGLEL